MPLRFSLNQSLRAFIVMASNIDQHSPEKDGSLQSSVAPRPANAARDLDEKRRSALAHIDNAAFSSVKFPKLFSPCLC